MEIRELRQQLGYTQSEFAERYKIPFRTIQNWETGLRKPPEYLVTLLENQVLEDLVNRKTALLPRYDTNGQEISYRIHEETIPEYDDVTTMTSVGPNYQMNIKNTYTGYAELQVTKEWEDYNNRYGVRPAFVTVELMKNGEPTGNKLVMSEDNSWHVEFKELDMSDSGVLNEYSVRENPEVDPYTPSITQTGPYTVLIKNVFEVTPANLVITKNWDDGNDVLGLRPNPLTFLNALKLSYQTSDGTTYPYDLGTFKLETNAGGTFTYSASGDPFVRFEVAVNGDVWTISVNNLPGKIKLPGHETLSDVVWTVAENDSGLAYYRLKEPVSGNMDEGFTITNEVDVVRFRGTKEWDYGVDPHDDNPPESAVILIHSSEQEGDEIIVTVQDNWVWESELLPRYNGAGNEIEYSIREEPIHGYKGEIGEIDTTNYPDCIVPVKNTFTGKDNILIIKLWDDADDRDGSRPGSIEVDLYQRGKDDPIDSIVITAADKWEGKFEDLDRTDFEGRPIDYYVKELDVSGYGTEIYIHDLGFEIINSHTPASAADVQVKKIWDDEDDVLGLRPSVDAFLSALQLHYESTEGAAENYDIGTFIKDEEKSDDSTYVYNFSKDKYTTAEVTGMSGDEWTVTFKNLPDYANWSVTEADIPNYIQDGEITGDMTSGYTIRNKPAVVRFTVLKRMGTWGESGRKLAAFDYGPNLY